MCSYGFGAWLITIWPGVLSRSCIARTRHILGGCIGLERFAFRIVRVATGSPCGLRSTCGTRPLSSFGGSGGVLRDVSHAL